MSEKPMYAVFLHPQAVETLGETIKPYLAPGEHAPHLICSEIDTGGALCELLLTGRDGGGNAVEVEVMLPLGMILMVVSVRGDGAHFGFRGHEAAAE